MKRRTVLVTGANSGIGAAVLERAQVLGHSCIATVRNSASKNITSAPAEVLDLAALTELPQRIESLFDQYPQIDALVASAGYGQFGSLEEFSYAQIGQLIEVDLTAQIFLARAALPRFKRRGYGDLVFLGSYSGIQGGRYGAVYAAAKAGLRGLSQALRAESARNDVRVTLINPGFVRTPFFDSLSFEPGENPDNAIEPNDVARCIFEAIDLAPGSCIDEINLTPQRTVVRRKPHL